MVITLKFKKTLNEEVNYNTGSKTHAKKNYISLSNYGTFGFHQPSKFVTFIFEARSDRK